MIIRALAAACLILGLSAWYYHSRTTSLSAALAVASAQVAQVRVADAVHRAHIARMEADAARWNDLLTDLQTIEGHDAPLSDYLRHAAGRVWP